MDLCVVNQRWTIQTQWLVDAWRPPTSTAGTHWPTRLTPLLMKWVLGWGWGDLWSSDLRPEAWLAEVDPLWLMVKTWRPPLKSWEANLTSEETFSSQQFGLSCFFLIFTTFHTADPHWRHQIYQQDMWINVAEEKHVKHLNMWCSLYFLWRLF